MSAAVPDLSPIEFTDLSPVEVKVTLNGQPHVLVEPSEHAVTKWRGVAISAAKLSDGKVSGIGSSMADAEPLLVSLCLFHITESGRIPVPEAVVRGWPHRVVDTLFKRIKQIGGLDDAEDKAGPKAPSELTPGTSS